MTYNLWYAVSKRGQGRVFTTLPSRSESFGCWLGEGNGTMSSLFMMAEADGMEVPSLTWKDEPVELTISVGFV